MDGCLFAMEIVGNYINGPLFKQWGFTKRFDDKKSRFGYYGSFGAGAILFAFGFFFVLFFFKEPKKPPPPPESKDANGRSVVSLKNVSNSFSVLVKEREGGMRHIVILTYACFAVCFSFVSVLLWLYCSWGASRTQGWTTCTSEGSSPGPTRILW